MSAFIISESEPEIIADYGCHCGENPLWNPVDGQLYWCDIPQGRLYRFDPRTAQHECCYQGEVVGGFTVEPDGALLLFMARGAVCRWWNGRLTVVLAGLPEETDSRFNDVIADPLGRVFCGTMATPARPGRLYRMDLDGRLTVVLEGVLCSNGLAFSLDHRQLYYADSYAREISVFDYDLQTATLSNRRAFVRSADADGLPDGITLDAEGYLWSAQWDGSCLIRYNAEGKEDRRIPFPVKKVSSLTFAGPDYRDLYVTTAGGDDRRENGEHAGALFRLHAGVSGIAEFPSRIVNAAE